MQFETLFGQVFLDDDASTAVTEEEQELSQLFAPEESPPPETPPETPTETESPTLVDRMREAGFQDLEDENQAVDRLYDAFLDRNKQLTELQQQVEQLRPLAGLAGELLNQRQSQPQDPPQTPQQGPTPPWGEQSPIDPNLLARYRERDQETGRLKWKDDTPQEIRNSAAQYELTAEQWANKILYQPEQAFTQGTAYGLVKALESGDPAVINALDKYIEQKVGTRLEKQTEEQFLDQIERENPWIYRTDPVTGQRVIDPLSGEPVPSERGALLFRYIDELKSAGMKDPRKIWEYATSRLPQTENGRTNGSRAEKQMEHLRRGAASVPDRSGSLPQTPEEQRSQNRHLRAGQKLLSEAEQLGEAFWQ